MSDYTDQAYETTWGTIRFINLNAAHIHSGHDHGTAFEAIRGGSQSAVDFKAFLKGFRDSFNPGWSEQQFPNQSSPVAHQVSPKRTIQFQFSVPAYSEKEAILNMRKCSFLAESMYPAMEPRGSTYNLKSSFMAIKFANLIQNTDGAPLPGYIMGFVFVPNLAEGVFINTKSGFNKFGAGAEVFRDDKQSYIIPKLIDIDITFTPIEIRDTFGYQVHDSIIGREGRWKDGGGWPHGVKIDKPGLILGGGVIGDLAPNSVVTDVINKATYKMLND